MLTSGQIKAKFRLKKSQVDFLVNRFRSEWGIKKDGSGRCLWSEYSTTRLEDHLKNYRPYSALNPVDAAESAPNLPAPNAMPEEAVMVLAKVLGEKLENMKNEFKAMLISQAERHRQELAQVRQELAAIKAAVILPSPRIERRRKSANWWDGVYRWFFLIPATGDRRRG